MRLGTIALLFAVGFTQPAFAEGVLKLAGTPYHERFEPTTEVAGGVVLGLQSVADNMPLDLRLLAVYASLAIGKYEVLCVQVATISGNYWSLNPYEPARTSGWTGLETVSKHARELLEFNDPAFALRAELRPRIDGDASRDPCANAGGATPTLLVAGLGTSASAPSVVTVLVNSKRSNEASAELHGADGSVHSPVSCKRIRNLSARVYDTRCDLQLGPTFKGRYWLVIKLVEPGEVPEVHRLALLLP